MTTKRTTRRAAKRKPQVMWAAYAGKRLLVVFDAEYRAKHYADHHVDGRVVRCTIKVTPC